VVARATLALSRRERVPVGRWAKVALVALGLALGPAAAARAQTGEPIPVDLELVLLVDVSGSVDQREYALQMLGLAAAFRDPEVHAALEATGERGIAVCLVHWAGNRQQVVVADWTPLADPAGALSFAERIEGVPRRLIGETAIGDALQFAITALETSGFAGFRQVIDISGDGPTNAGRQPAPVRDAAIAAGITINGLAIVNEVADLDQYYREHVIGGPDAFLIVADDYHAFAQAIRDKLIREIGGAALASSEAPVRVLARR
jgi:hypothetical protein